MNMNERVECSYCLMCSELLLPWTIPGGAKKRPELSVTITVRVLYGEKFPFAHIL